MYLSGEFVLRRYRKRPICTSGWAKNLECTCGQPDIIRPMTGTLGDVRLAQARTWRGRQ